MPVTGYEGGSDYTGTFSEDGNIISGAWETSPADGGQWEHDFALTYRRLT